MVQTFKIFLASSSDLVDDRRALEIHIGRINKDWVPKGVHLVLEQWEDFLDVMAPDSLQHEYQRAVRNCDLFVMLFCTRVGEYTQQEFDAAFQQFHAGGRPQILTYFKDAPISTANANRDDLASLWGFQQRLQQLGHFQTHYKNTEDLLLQLRQQLDKLVAPDVPRPGPNGSAIHSEGGTHLQASTTRYGTAFQRASLFRTEVEWGYAGLGGLLPTLCRLSAMTASNPDADVFRPGHLAALMLFFSIAVIACFGFQEKSKRQAFMLGVCIPGIFTALASGLPTQNSYVPNEQISSSIRFEHLLPIATSHAQELAPKPGAGATFWMEFKEALGFKQQRDPDPVDTDVSIAGTWIIDTWNEPPVTAGGTSISRQVTTSVVGSLSVYPTNKRGRFQGTLAMVLNNKYSVIENFSIEKDAAVIRMIGRVSKGKWMDDKLSMKLNGNQRMEGYAFSVGSIGRTEVVFVRASSLER